MKFYVVSNGVQLPARPKYPFVTLDADNWDDYGYRTSFDVILHLSADEVEKLGTVKILRDNQEGGATSMPEKPFTSLGPNYASLGHSLDYYETIYKLGPVVRRTYLESLGDVAWSDERRAAFEDLEGYRVSLLRFSGAERLVEEASRFLRQERRTSPQKRRGFSLGFKTRFAEDGPSLVAKFSFVRRGQLPNRINAIIGYNGTGKTKLLSNLAIVASEYGYDSKEAYLNKAAGRFVESKPPITRVVVISYSAFDSFVIPDEEEAERVGYIYCGLRTNVHPIDQAPKEPIYGLKSPEAIEREFLRALKRIHEADRLAELRAALDPLLDDPSFRRIGLSGLLERFNDDHYIQYFRGLSSGHKIVVKIITELVAFMDGTDPTLVLIDEPETHLHPPLVAAFLRSVRECLDTLNGFAIVATHSPVVLQELPSRYVRVLRRHADRARMETPTIETFGESIGMITQHVFNLDDGSTDWHATLMQLAARYTLEEIEKHLGKELGFAARSFVASERIAEDE